MPPHTQPIVIMLNNGPDRYTRIGGLSWWPVLVACLSGLSWWPVLVACLSGRSWWPVLVACLSGLS